MQFLLSAKLTTFLASNKYLENQLHVNGKAHLDTTIAVFSELFVRSFRRHYRSRFVNIETCSGLMTQTWNVGAGDV